MLLCVRDTDSYTTNLLVRCDYFKYIRVTTTNSEEPSNHMSSITFSVEIELAWGHHDTGDFSNLSNNRRAEIKYLKKFLDFCDSYGIPITFGIVGHLFHNNCQGTHDGPYPSSWFNSDPGTNVAQDSLFYAPDLIELIKDAEANHEICTHTFSHTPFGQIGEEVFRYDLERGLELQDDYLPSSSTSLIPPRNFAPPLEMIEEMGIKSVRLPSRPPAFSSTGKYLNRVKEWTLYKGHPVFSPDFQQGVVLSYSTRYPSLTAVHLPNGKSPPLPIFKKVPEQLRQRIHLNYLRRGVKKAQRQNANAHYWTHLQNMSNQLQMGVIKQFFEWVGQQDSSKPINIKRIQDIGPK